MNLASKLEKLIEGSKAKIPAATREIMHRATNELRGSGILDGVLKVGSPAPAFALANAHGERVTLAELRARGHVVMTFYRGVW